VATHGPADDLSLLQRIAARDDAALAELYDRHHRLAFAIIRRIVQSPSDAEEVLQETFVRVWSRAETYDARLGSPAAWVVRIARNRAIDRVRARQARADVNAPVPAPDDAGSARDLPSHDTPESVLHSTYAARAVRGAVAALPPAQRTLIEAAFFEGYTHQELAARFGVPLGTVKTRIRNGLLSLRGRLEQTA
jgi:RNA polymerase sigma-70 factor (ECF subfamily)